MRAGSVRAVRTIRRGENPLFRNHLDRRVKDPVLNDLAYTR